MRGDISDERWRVWRIWQFVRGRFCICCSHCPLSNESGLSLNLVVFVLCDLLPHFGPVVQVFIIAGITGISVHHMFNSMSIVISFALVRGHKLRLWISYILLLILQWAVYFKCFPDSWHLRLTIFFGYVSSLNEPIHDSFRLLNKLSLVFYLELRIILLIEISIMDHCWVL